VSSSQGRQKIEKLDVLESTAIPAMKSRAARGALALGSPTGRNEAEAASAGLAGLRNPWQHTSQSAIAKNEVVDERPSSMERGEDDKSVRQSFMNFLHVMCKRFVLRPRRCDIESAKHGKRVAIRKLRRDANGDNRRKQRVERKVDDFGGQIAQSPQRRRFWRRRRVD
jgi:hypothetical protein